MGNKWSVRVTVVAMGRPIEVRAERLRTVRIFIDRVVEQAEVTNLVEYELRDAEGYFIDPGVLVKDTAAIREGATLYLNPRAGIGAESMTLAPDSAPEGGR